MTDNSDDFFVTRLQTAEPMTALHRPKAASLINVKGNYLFKIN